MVSTALELEEQGGLAQTVTGEAGCTNTALHSVGSSWCRWDQVLFSSQLPLRLFPAPLMTNGNGASALILTNGSGASWWQTVCR